MKERCRNIFNQLKVFWGNASKPVRFGLVLFLLVVGIFFLRSGYTYFFSAPKTNTPVTTTVQALEVRRADLEKRIVLSGQTVPKAQVDIAAKYQGRILSVNVELGDQVHEGQILIIQDTGDAQISIYQNEAAYRQASADVVTAEVTFQANYERAKANYEKVQSTYNRYNTLHQVGGISQQELENKAQDLADARSVFNILENQKSTRMNAATVDSAQAAADKAYYSIQAIEKQRDDLILRAPRSGMIGFRQAEVGVLVQAGAKLLSIVDNSEIYMDAAVSEQDIPALTLGTPVQVEIESLGKVVTGTITYISPAKDPQTQSFSIRILLSRSDPDLRGGMFARSVISSILRPNALIVPKEAILNKNGRTYLFVIGPGNKLIQKEVKVGADGDLMVEILSGINEGDVIAVNNLSRLRENLVVTPQAVTLQSLDEAARAAGK